MANSERLEKLIVAAQGWAEAGVPVFPVKEDKAPLTTHGFHDAVSTPNEVRTLFEFYGDAAWGIGGSMGDGIFAVDVDLYKSSDVKAWYDARLEDGSLTETRIHQTKSGGLHFLYEGSAPDCKPHAGVEVKSDGGYIVLPPSPNYKVMSEGITQAPQRLLETLRYSSAAARGSTVSQLEANIMSGADFHNSLTQLGAKKVAAGKSQVEVQKYILDLMNASSASQPGHERHARWRAIMSDKGGELSRISISANRKYNDDAVNEEFEEIETIGQLVAVDNAVFVDPTLATPEPTIQNLPTDKWPYSEKEGYFAHEHLDVSSVEFNLYPLYVQNETALIIANPKMGKTAFALTTALHMASGIDLGDLKVSGQSAVLYYGLEGRHAIGLRTEAWKQEMYARGTDLPSSIPLFTVTKSANFLKTEARAAEASQIISAARYSERFGTPLRAIFIDTLTKAMSGGDQNSVEDTSSLFEVVSLIRDAGITATIIFVHHEAKSGGSRGSSNIVAEADLVMQIKKKDDVITTNVSMARSIEDGARYSFKISSVDLGKTKQGYPLTSMFLDPVENTDDDDTALQDADLIAQRRKIIVDVCTASGGSASADAVVKAWFSYKLIAGRPARGGDVAPRLESAPVREALSKVADDAGGTRYGNTIIMVTHEGGNVVQFTTRSVT